MKTARLNYAKGTVGGELWLHGTAKLGRTGNRHEEVVLEVPREAVLNLARAILLTPGSIGHAAYHFESGGDLGLPCSSCEPSSTAGLPLPYAEALRRFAKESFGERDAHARAAVEYLAKDPDVRALAIAYLRAPTTVAGDLALAYSKTYATGGEE